MFTLVYKITYYSQIHKEQNIHYKYNNQAVVYVSLITLTWKQECKVHWYHVTLYSNRPQ